MLFRTLAFQSAAFASQIAGYLLLILLLPLTSIVAKAAGTAADTDLKSRCDINGDGSVDYADAAILRAHQAGAKRYDINGDGRVNAADTQLIISQADRRPTELGYQPIRKVHAHMRTWNGNWDRNPRGLTSWWAFDVPHHRAVQTLRQKIERLAAGASVRHFVLQLPGGSVRPRMCPSQFWPMPAKRRELLGQMSRELKEIYPDIQLGVYCGWGIDPTPETTEINGWRYPDWDSQADRRAIVHLYKGWGDIGFDFLVLDAITGQGWRDGTALSWLRYLEEECAVRTIGEAYPLMRKGRGRVNDEGAMNEHAWMALQRYIDRRKIQGHPVSARYMGLNGFAKGFRDSQANRLRIVSECVERGFIPWIYNYGTSRESVELFRHAVDELADQEVQLRRQGRSGRSTP